MVFLASKSVIRGYFDLIDLLSSCAQSYSKKITGYPLGTRQNTASDIDEVLVDGDLLDASREVVLPNLKK